MHTPLRFTPAAHALALGTLLIGLAACSTTPTVSPPSAPAPVVASVATPAVPAPVASAPAAESSAPSANPALACPPPTAAPVCQPEPPKPPPAAPWRAAEWDALPGWQSDDLAQTWPALLSSCRVLKGDMQKAWGATCAAAAQLGATASTASIRDFLQTQLAPWQLINADASETGLITGYYEPLIRGSRSATAKYATPVLGVPEDLIVVNLGELYPELKNMRLRGRIEGRKLVPYWTSAELDAKTGMLPAKTLLWTDDLVEYVFLQIQGSGQVQLEDGSRVRIAYADQNGHPFKSIARWLINQGELTIDKASMQGIQAWARNNPKRIPELIAANPSYVFFREETTNGEGPKGAQGLPLTAGRSIAVDPRSISMGTPVFLAFNTMDGKPVQRLMLAQDTGGAIRGRVRADFYWGFGADAGAIAGRMRQQGRMWVLWPRGSQPPAIP
ncbi:MAG: MltA domain-containing protein [Rhodocyclaceae bacterium]